MTEIAYVLGIPEEIVRSAIADAAHEIRKVLDDR